MSENDHSRFDLEIKALMDSAEEVVPQGVWEGVCGRLDSAGTVVPARNVIVPVWLRRTLEGVAIAAAVVSAVVLIPWGGSGPLESGEEILAVVPSQEVLADVPEEMVNLDGLRPSETPSVAKSSVDVQPSPSVQTSFSAQPSRSGLSQEQSAASTVLTPSESGSAGQGP